MHLVDLWNEGALEGKHLPPVIGIAGDGKLADNNETSQEFREFLQIIPLAKLKEYAEECCLLPVQKHVNLGFALQDIINEVGRRLDFEVENGRYRGVRNEVGYDGLWKLSSGESIIVEVKTTDVYNLKLETLARYRDDLISREKSFSKEDISFLLVVGRGETDSLESQIRGSRYAWDMRLISVSSLLALAELKEKMEDESVFYKVRRVLIPEEFTKLDKISDLFLSVVADVEEEEPDAEVVTDVEEEEPDAEVVTDVEEEEPGAESASSRKGGKPASFHEECLARFEEKKNLPSRLVRRTRAAWSSSDRKYGVVCKVSKQFQGESFWFTPDTRNKSFLEKVEKSYFILGCGSVKTLFAIPSSDFLPLLEKLHKTERFGRTFWHIRVYKDRDKWFLKPKLPYENVDISKYLL